MPSFTDVIDPITGLRNIAFPNGAGMSLAPDQYTAASKPIYYVGDNGIVHWGFDYEGTGPVGKDFGGATNPSGGNEPGSAPTPTQAKPDLRAEGRNRLNELFTPGFDLSRIPSSAGDQFIDAILNEGRSNAQQSLDRARARGTLAPSGYDAAIAELGRKATGARSRLSDAAAGIVGAGRQQLRDAQAGALNAANTMPQDGDKWMDMAPFEKQLDQISTQYNTGLEGRLRNAVPSDTLFDVGQLITTGGSAQGPQSSGSALLSSLTDRNIGGSRNRRRTTNSGQVF